MTPAKCRVTDETPNLESRALLGQDYYKRHEGG
jgi:hypothetical protein